MSQWRFTQRLGEQIIDLQTEIIYFLLEQKLKILNNLSMKKFICVFKNENNHYLS